MTTAATTAPERRRRRLSGSNFALGAIGLFSIGALLEILPRIGVMDRRFFPPSSEILTMLLRQLGEPGFWTAVGQTMRGWAIGLTIAMVAGVLAGVVIGSIPVLREFTASTIEFLRPIPSVALIPLVVLLYGTKIQSALILIVYAAFWQILVQVLYGVADVDPVVRDTARSYRFSRWTQFKQVVWPTALPYVVTGFRLAAAVALILEVTAELVIGVPGLGRTLGIAQSSGAVTLTYALVVAIGIIGIIINLFARYIERRVLRWHPSVRRDVAA